MVNMKKALQNMQKAEERKGLTLSVEELKINRKVFRLKRLAKRIMRKKARQEEIQEFNKLKKDFKIEKVNYNAYTKDFEFELEERLF